MRIDKYLKVTRLIKRRAAAKELLDRGIFLINGKVAKPSSEVKQNDMLTLSLGRHQLLVKVLNCLEHANKEQANKMYEIIEDNIINEIEPKIE